MVVQDQQIDIFIEHSVHCQQLQEQLRHVADRPPSCSEMTALGAAHGADSPNG